jgi:Na+/melibiose symporter-like transporter
MLMSWIPSIITFAAAALMFLYPLTSAKMSEISAELQSRRTLETDAELLQ